MGIFPAVRHSNGPRWHIWFHPADPRYSDDFCGCAAGVQGLLLHELTHVWQRQQGVYLPLRRHPFCRYGYALKPGQPFARYGLEQQAEIVRHAFLIREGYDVPGAPSLRQYRSLLPFTPG